MEILTCIKQVPGTSEVEGNNNGDFNMYKASSGN